MSDYTLVEQPDSIRAELAQYDRVGVDTEFMRESTFFAELCLIQVATGDATLCVDPQGDGEMGPFWDQLCDRTWVLHSGRQDIEVVYQAAGKMPRTIFDTQIAAGLAGLPPQLGYAGSRSFAYACRWEWLETRETNDIQFH